MSGPDWKLGDKRKRKTQEKRPLIRSEGMQSPGVKVPRKGSGIAESVGIL